MAAFYFLAFLPERILKHHENGRDIVDLTQRIEEPEVK
jgi:hypothetical protein